MHTPVAIGLVEFLNTKCMKTAAFSRNFIAIKREAMSSNVFLPRYHERLPFLSKMVFNTNLFKD